MEKLYVTEKSGRDNYMVICPKSVPLFEMEYLNRREIKGNLPLEICLQDGDTKFWYRLTGCMSIRTMLELRIFGEKELLSLMREIYGFSKELERNLLNPLGILISLDTVFYKEAKSYSFCYYPTLEAELKEGLLPMIEEMLTLVDYKNQNMVKQLYHIYEMLNQENPDYEKLMLPLQTSVVQINEPKEDVCVEEVQEISKNPGFHPELSRSATFLTATQQKVKEVLKDKVAQFSKSTRKKWKNYTNIKPVIIKPEQVCESPTVYLTENKKEESYCLEEEGQLSTGRIILSKERTVLGKHPETADEIIEDESVSRLHAFITKENGGYYLEDLNSLNGTFVNGERLAYKQKVRLKENDKIEIGRKTFSFCSL